MGNKFLSIVTNLNRRIIDLEACSYELALLTALEERIDKLESHRVSGDGDTKVLDKITSLSKEIDNL